MLKRCLLTICFGLVLAIAALADSEGGSYPYTMESADKKYIFAMLRGCNRGENDHFYSSEKYPESGLYLNDGSTTPLWTVDWCGYVLLPADGIHVVRMMGPWARTSEGYAEEAITFFAYGKLLKSYRISDLVTIPYLLSHSSSHYRWQRLIASEEGAQDFSISIMEDRQYPSKAGVVFDTGAQTMTLDTLQGDRFVFDLNTGEVVSARRPVRTIAISLLTLFVLFYAWYLMRATARPRLPLWKDYSSLSFSALVKAWLFTLVGVGLLTVAGLTHADSANAPVFAAFLRFFNQPINIAQRNEWPWAIPYGQIYLYAQARGVLYLIGFWFAVFAVVGLVNNILVRCLRSARRRWTGGSAAKSSGGEERTTPHPCVVPETIRSSRFKEVQYFSRFWLGGLACFLSIFASLSLAGALERPEFIADPSTILILVFVGVLLPLFFLNVKMVTEVGNDHVVVGLRLLRLQKRKVAFDEIRHCSIQHRYSLEHADLTVERYAVWAHSGVMIELTGGSWVLVGSQRPQELLAAIQRGHKPLTSA